MSIVTAHEAQGGIWTHHREITGRGAWAAVRRQRALFLCITFGFPLLFYALLLTLLVGRFGNVPNYATFDDWFGNVTHIVTSTRSVSDMLPIIMNEWFVEIGYMNYAYGRGVSEWSLLIIPHKLAMVTMIGALIGLNFALIADQNPSGSLLLQCARSVRCGLMTSVGALCASVTSVTLFWVVCHSSPSWVVSLAILGVEVSTSLSLEPVGPAISLGGFALLILSALLILRDNRPVSKSAVMWPDKESASC